MQQWYDTWKDFILIQFDSKLNISFQNATFAGESDRVFSSGKLHYYTKKAAFKLFNEKVNIPKNQSQTFKGAATVPALPPSMLEGCNIIELQYNVIVRFLIEARMSKDLLYSFSLFLLGTENRKKLYLPNWFLRLYNAIHFLKLRKLIPANWHKPWKLTCLQYSYRVLHAVSLKFQMSLSTVSEVLNFKKMPI